MLFLSRTRNLFISSKTLIPPISLHSISTSLPLSQEPQVQETPVVADTSTPTPTPTPTPLPPNPSTGSPLYQENWRNPVPNANAQSPFVAQSLLALSPVPGFHTLLSQNLDVSSLLNVFADWMTSQRWGDLKQLFELWIRSLDKNGKPNKPDVNLYNHYLMASFMLDASAGDLLDLIVQMDDYQISPNTASYNIVLKAMYKAREGDAAEKLLYRMLQTGKESLPNDESYDLVIGLLFLENKIDSALKYLDMTLKAGYMVSMKVFSDCVRSCVNAGRLDTLVSIIERCKAMDQNKALCPSWNLSNHIAEVALQADNSKLAFYALEFLAKWIAIGENARPAVLLSVDEGLVVSAFATAARTYNSTLVDASWAILKRSLRQKRVPNPESFLAKINAHASLENLQRAFSTLNEFEAAYGDASNAEGDLFSPFTSLHPLVVACSKNGFTTLDSVYYQLEKLSRNETPYKSVAALNCIILGCANIWDLDRAYQTFEAIGSTFGLTANIHSYNALMCAFGKLKKTFEASRVFEHLISLGVKPNAKSYSLLVDAHLINKDQKAALSVIEEMEKAGFTPSKEILKKVRRRCSRESDFDSDDVVESLAKKFKYRMGNETRREILFNLNYGTNYS